MTELAVIILATVFNALADRHYPITMFSWRSWTPAQWRWHIFKWLHFYPPLIYIIWRAQMPLVTIILFAFICLIVWRTIYNWKR